jgi:NAD(P)-dependent dehydrogenase (short-subunit alcohol dehydrogenase family)
MTELAKFGSLRGKRVFVTGGGTGIGEAIVETYAQQGAHVAFVDIAQEASLGLVERIKAAGHPAPRYR